MLELLEELMDTADRGLANSERLTGNDEIHACDGCRVAKDDVDLWAEDTETGEQLWLCEACGDW